jgi:serine/threonine-protein kinase
MAHANICQVYELDETDGQLYIVMEYLEGVTLLPLLRRASRRGTQLDFGFVAAVIAQICDALNYAHEIRENGESLNIVHRDVTPANIMLTESGVAKMLDFGIAKVRNASSKTEDGTVKGKYAYMAPEQLRGTTIDRRVDVFALGVVLFETLALRRLFQRKTDYLTFRAVMEQPIPDVRTYRPETPDALANVLARALERDPDARWDTARVFGAAVTDAISPFRPWTQGEIGDLVHGNFADEIGRRSHQVQTAVHRVPRTTMPLIAQPDHAEPEGEQDDDGFPSIETDLDNSIEVAPSKFESPAGHTPPPFALETSPSGASIAPIRPINQATTGSVVVVAPRSLLWPIVAIAAVAITAVALVLVWQMSKQPAPPPSVVIEQRADSSPANVTPLPVETGSEKTVLPPDKPPPPADYNKPVTARQRALEDCVSKNGGVAALPAGSVATIDIDTAGKAKVVLAPPVLDSKPLGGCIKRVIEAAQFPAGPHELKLRLH